MNSKICTSLEQSKRLLELGIDKKSSDMFYWYGEKNVIRIGGHEKQSEFFDIPAWSFSALLELIPNWTMDKTDKVNLTCNPYYHCESCCENPIDAAFEMVVWLKENNKI